MAIRRLSSHLVNQIAAGEVIERPAAVLKELLENALDAGATVVSIAFRQAGQSFLSVCDNGAGIPRDELPLAIERHATSKLPEDHLLQIRTFGFRGEALPAIGAVSRLCVTSRPHSQAQAWSLTVDGGKISDLRPTSAQPGTTIEVADLFFATPARLKFLKSERSELLAIRQLMEQVSLAHPNISFEVRDEKRVFLHYPAGTEDSWETLIRERLSCVLGDCFATEALALDVERNGYRLKSFLGLPTAHGPNSQNQFFFVNGRPVKDKILSSVVKVAYADVLPMGRFPSLVLFLEVPLAKVDVNVHPAKTEVRFSEGAFLKEFVLDSLKRALMKRGTPTTQGLAQQTLSSFAVRPQRGPFPSLPTAFSPQRETPVDHLTEMQEPSFASFVLHTSRSENQAPSQTSVLPEMTAFPLGYAIGQIHQSYILAQNETGFLIVDQHAAHERLLYEKLKASLATGDVQSEALLIPLILQIAESEEALLKDNIPLFKKFGLDLSFWGDKTVALRAVPSLLKGEDWELFIREILLTLSHAEREDLAPENPLERALWAVLSSLACQRHSLKAGKKLTLPEMNQLLRDMEKTPYAAQCNHGRPTYIQLELGQLETLFKRHG